ncbi:unnamed protein product [Prunus armeniaca]
MDGDQRRFHRLYICLEACKTGFLQGCRPVIGMDGCFIKGPHPGQLLAAVGIDWNNGMFSLAYAVVEIENKETWEWFIRNLITDLAIENDMARDKPILSMLEGIRTNLMVRMANMRVVAWKWKRHVGPRIEQIMKKNKLEWLSIGPYPLLPPLFKKQTRRPRKKRAREQGDPPAATKGNKLSKWVHDKFSCSKCSQAGHNKKTCGKSTSQQVARGGRKMQQSRSNSNAPAGTSISQPSLVVVMFSQPSPTPQVASQPPIAHNSLSQQASTSQTVQRRKLKSPAKK